MLAPRERSKWSRRPHTWYKHLTCVLTQRPPRRRLATVYTTFNLMAERGLVRALPFADAVRYDANLNPHANLVCTRCGRITDFEGCDDVLAILRERTAGWFRLQQERIDLYGLCRDCQEPAAQATGESTDEATPTARVDARPPVH